MSSMYQRNMRGCSWKEWMKASSKMPMKILAYFEDTFDPIAAPCICRHETLKVKTLRWRVSLISQVISSVLLWGEGNLAKKLRTAQWPHRVKCLCGVKSHPSWRGSVCGKESVAFKSAIILKWLISVLHKRWQERRYVVYSVVNKLGNPFSQGVDSRYY